MVIKKSQTTQEKIAAEGMVWDYPLPTEDVGIARQELNGHVPDTGWHKNTVCYEVCYIISGEATFYVDDEQYEVGAGDAVVIEAGKKSRIEAKYLQMLTITTPNWYPEQSQQLND